MILGRSSFLIHREKTITEIYREDSLKELIDRLIAHLESLKRLDFGTLDRRDIESTLFLMTGILEECTKK